MSIFFWKKKKSEPETETQPAETSVVEPAEEGPAAEAPKEEPAEEGPAVEAPEEETAAEEPAAGAPEVETAAEAPEEEPSAEEDAAEEPSEEPSEEETVPEEPSEEPFEKESVPEEPSEEPSVEEGAELVPYETETGQEEPEAERDFGETRVFEPVPAVQPEDGGTYMPAAPREEEPGAGAVAVVDEEDEYEERKPRRKSHALLWIFFLLCVIGFCYYYGMTYSRTHFLENTFINGQDVSNMTAPEVEKILSQKAEGYELKVTFRDGEVEVIDGDDIGFKVKPDGSVDRILQSQDHRKWFMCFFRRTDGNVEQNTTYDPDRLRQAINSLPELQEDYMVKPVDAYIELHDTTFSIIPEVEGNYVDIGMVQNAATEAVRKEIKDVVVTDLEGAYKVPSVRADDADIIEKCDSYNHMLAGSITWDLPNGETMTLDSRTTVNWLSRDENGDYYRDGDLWEENIEYWVDELARNVNTVGQDWSFHSTSAGNITVSGGDYGYSVNKVDEREEVWDLLWEGESDEREPYFYTKQYNEGSGLGGTYIEANLSRQHVWIYIDGAMVCDTDCVSGNVNLGRGTPTGVFQILYKDTEVDLKGQQLANGQYSYISHVKYWMPFYGGCGFHDASWRTSFGGNIYRSDGSHGCINLPPSIAPKFYSYVRTGMPVVVYY